MVHRRAFHAAKKKSENWQFFACNGERRMFQYQTEVEQRARTSDRHAGHPSADDTPRGTATSPAANKKRRARLSGLMVWFWLLRHPPLDRPIGTTSVGCFL